MTVTREEFMAVCRDRDEAVLAIPKWIPVSERLPVDIPHGYCLVTDGTEVGTANYSKESGNWDHCIDRDYWKPTHWMKLPEPPEVK